MSSCLVLIDVAEENLVQEFHAIGQDLRSRAVSKASGLEQSQIQLEAAVSELDGLLQKQVEKAREVKFEFEKLSEDVADLGDPAEWLKLSEAHLRSMANELQHIDAQINEARLKQEPA